MIPEVPFALTGTHKVALGFKKVGDPSSRDYEC